MGDYVYLVAVMWTAAKLAGSTAGLVAASESGASLALAAAGGIIADRVDRRRAMIAADVASAIALGLLAMCTLHGQLGITPLVVTAVVVGGSEAIFTPALMASIPALIASPPAGVDASAGLSASEALQATNGLMDATRRIARAIGPSIAGAIAAFVSLGYFFAIDALSFAASAAAIFFIGPRFRWKADRSGERHAGSALSSIARDLGDALRVVGANRKVAWVLGTLFLVNASWAAGFQVGGVLLASQTLHAGISGYGFLVGAYGAGNVAGNLVVGNIHVDRKASTVFASRIVLGAGFLVLAFAPSLPFAMAGAALAAVGGPMGELPHIALLQTEFPPHQAGRIFSLRFLIEQAGVATGLVLAAPLFAAVSVRAGIALSAAILLIAGTTALARFGFRA